MGAIPKFVSWTAILEFKMAATKPLFYGIVIIVQARYNIWPKWANIGGKKCYKGKLGILDRWTSPLSHIKSSKLGKI